VEAKNIKEKAGLNDSETGKIISVGEVRAKFGLQQ
jgi:hypothetical protein